MYANKDLVTCCMYPVCGALRFVLSCTLLARVQHWFNRFTPSQLYYRKVLEIIIFFCKLNTSLNDSTVGDRGALKTGVVRGCTGCTCTSGAEKKSGPNLQGKVVSAPPGRGRVHFRKSGRSGRRRGYLGSLNMYFEGND